MSAFGRIPLATCLRFAGLIGMVGIIAACGERAATAPSQAGKTGGAAVADIVGLHIGMSPEEVRLALPKINPAFKVAEAKQNGWNALIVSATTPSELIVVKFTETEPKAWFIGRSVAFQTDQMPPIKDLSKDLVSKYGKPSVSEADQISDWFAWSSGTDQSQDSEGNHSCKSDPRNVEQWRARAPGSVSFFQRAVTGQCSRLIEAWVGRPNFGSELAQSVSVSILELPLWSRDPRNPETVEAAKRQQQVEDARKNKPKI